MIRVCSKVMLFVLAAIALCTLPACGEHQTPRGVILALAGTSNGSVSDYGNFLILNDGSVRRLRYYYVVNQHAIVKILPRSVVNVRDATRFAPLPCDPSKSVFLKSFAVSDDGRFVGCVGTAYGESDIRVSDLVAHTVRRIKHIPVVFANPGAHYIGFGLKHDLLALPLDQTCPGGPDSAPTRLMIVDLDRGDRTEMGPCTLSVVVSASQLVIAAREESSEADWRFRTPLLGSDWIDGNPQAIAGNQVLFINSDGELQWTGDGRILMKNMVAARYASLKSDEIALLK